MAHRRQAVLARLYSPTGRALSAFVAFSMVLTSGAGLLSRPARAADLPRVMVLPYAPIYDVLPRTSGVKAAEVLMNELKSSEQLQLVTVKADKASASVAPPKSPGPARDANALNDAKDRAGKAEDFTKKLKFRQAADELEKVIALYEGQHPYIDFNDLVTAYLNVAVAYFRLGLDSEGEKALAQVVRLAPETKLDAEKYPPVFLRAFENVTKKVQKAPKGSIQVDPTAPGASVVLDGREVGKAPLLIKDVLKGVHYLRVIPASGGEWSNRVDVGGGASVKLTPDVGSPGGPVAEIGALLARNTIDDALIARVIALTEQNPADFVVLGGVHKEGDGIVVSSHLLKVSTKKTCLLQRVVFDQEMLGAGIEIYKVGTDITNKLDVFGDGEKLPAKVARDALAPSASSRPIAVTSVGPSTSANPDVAPEPDSGRVVRPRATDTPRATPKAEPVEVHKVTASETPELVPLEPTGPGEEPGKVKSSNTGLIVGIVIGAVAVLAAGALGTYFGVTAANKPITGTGTISW